MSTLLEISAIAKSNNLKDMMILLFESENQKDLITTNNMNMIAENLSIRVSEREILIGKLDHCPCTMAYDSAKLLREMNDFDLAKIRRGLHFGSREVCLITCFRFGAVSFSSYSNGDMKFKERVFPHRVGLSITSLDLVGVVEDEEYFSQLCNEDAIRVCLLLCLEVIFMGKLMVKEVDDTLMRLVKSLEAWNAFPWGLHKSRKYVPTYILGGFVWSFKVWILESFEMSNHWWNKLAEAIPRGIGWSKKAIFLRADYGTLFCKELNPIYELRPSLAENKCEWWTSMLNFLQVYIPRTPIRKPNLFYEYLQKVSDSRKRNRLCRLISTPISNVPRSKISNVKDCINKVLNSRIFKLEAIIHVLGRERNSDVVQKLEFSDDYSGLSIEYCEELNHAFLELVESSFIASVGTQSDDDTEEECHEVYHTEDFLLEEEFMRHLLEEERLKLEQECELQVKKRWDEDYRKRSYAFINSNHMKQAMAHCDPKKRCGSVGVRNDSWVQVCRKFDKKNKCFGVVDRDMTAFLKTVKPWVETKADKVFIPINETRQHWCLAEFDIKSDVVTFYDNGGLYDLELKDWNIGTRDCLKV
ncbi:phospholipase-like protein [Tanacetum coccineum]